MMKVGFVSLGCSKNLVVTEEIIGLFKKRNYEIVGDPADAEILLINTCGFIESAKEEQKKQIEEVRSDLAQAIDSARKNFQDKQENIENKIQSFEQRYSYNNGYLFLQMVLLNRNDMFMFGSYMSLAIMYFSVYAETDEKFSERLLFSIKKLSTTISECNDNTVFNFKFIIEKLKEAQKNVRKDSVYWHKLQELIETIENLDNKQSVEKTFGAAIEKE